MYGQTATRFDNTVDDRFAFMRFETDILGKTPKIVNAGIHAFSRNRKRLPPIWPFRMREVIERRK